MSKLSDLCIEVIEDHEACRQLPNKKMAREEKLALAATIMSDALWELVEKGDDADTWAKSVLRKVESLL